MISPGAPGKKLAVKCGVIFGSEDAVGYAFGRDVPRGVDRVDMLDVLLVHMVVFDLEVSTGHAVGVLEAADESIASVKDI